jgi:hypothetical protein
MATFAGRGGKDDGARGVRATGERAEGRRGFMERAAP